MLLSGFVAVICNVTIVLSALDSVTRFWCLQTVPALVRLQFVHFTAAFFSMPAECLL